MKRIISIYVLIAFAAWLTPVTASATILGSNYEITSVGDNPYGVTSNGGTGNFSCALDTYRLEKCTVDKTFTSIGDIPVVIQTKANLLQSQLTGLDLIHVDENITNTTGTDWTDFHFGFAPIDNGPMTLSFLNVLQSGGFSQAIATASSLDLNGGIVANNTSFDISFDLQISSRPGDYDLFAVTEQPSISKVPEPETLALFALGLVGLRYLRFKRKS